MDPEDFAQQMRMIFDEGHDPEVSHPTADNVILELLTEMGYGEGAAIFDEADKWYS